MTKTYSYKHLPGYFDFTSWEDNLESSFGLTKESWEAFVKEISDLNESYAASGLTKRIKVFYATRHGEGWHNYYERLYGREASRTTYGTVDPEQTKLGDTQVLGTAQACQREIAKGMPVPEMFFTSPLRRAGQTMGQQWGWLFEKHTEDQDQAKAQSDEGTNFGPPVSDARADDKGPSEASQASVEPVISCTVAPSSECKDEGHSVPAIVIENTREAIYLGPENRRRTLTEMKASFPSYEFNMNMTEQDEQFDKQRVIGADETLDDRLVRIKKGFDGIVTHMGDTTHAAVASSNGFLEATSEVLGVPVTRVFSYAEMRPWVVEVDVEPAWGRISS